MTPTKEALPEVKIDSLPALSEKEVAEVEVTKNEEDFIPGLKEMSKQSEFVSRAALERVLDSVYGTTVILQRVDKTKPGISGPLKVKLGHQGEAVFTGTITELTELLDTKLSLMITGAGNYDKALNIYNSAKGQMGLKIGRNVWDALKFYPDHVQALKRFSQAVSTSSASPAPDAAPAAPAL